MRFKIFFFLAFFATSTVTAQLYDNRNRYLQSPYNYNRFGQELDGPPKKPTNQYAPRVKSSQNSYNNYQNRVNQYSRAYLTTDEFYKRFRDPKIHRRYSSFLGKEEALPKSISSNPENWLNFNCFCFLPVDILSFFNWHDSNKKELEQKRQDYINNQEEEYSKEMSKRGFPKNYVETFKDQQKRFFNRYVQKFNSWFEGGKKTSYWDHKNRIVSELKNTAESFDYKFEKHIATSVVFNFLKQFKANPRNTASPIKYVGDLKIGKQFVRNIPPNNYDNYDLVKSLLQRGDRGAINQLHVRNIYNYLKNPSNNLDDYLTDRYIKQYDNEYNLYKRFAFQSAYMIDHLRGHHLTPQDMNRINNEYDFSGYMTRVPYDRVAITNFYRNSSSATGYSMSFEKAKAMMAINSFPSNVSDYIQSNSYIKSGVVNYLKNAIPIYEELNTVNELVSSRMDNKPFKWSNQLRYLRSWSYQQSRTPETIMKINLKASLPNWLRIREYGIKYSLRIDYDIMTYDFHMHDGIGDMLKKIYRNSSSWSVEGATIRHFLESKTNVKIPGSLSNYDLGKLFDFGGGNSNTLTIQFSDYAKKYITNFQHYDGKYGTSLFTDLVKLKKLYDILKERPVDFSNNKKPCIGDPVPNPEIAPSGISGKKGGTFGCTRVDVTVCKGMSGRKNHDGLDITAEIDAPLYATHSGTIFDVRNLFSSGEYKKNSYGNFIIIKTTINGKLHYVKYNHLNRVDVKKGEPVVAGNVIGLNGNTGNANPPIKPPTPHLHMQVFDSNWNSVNPLDFIKTKFDSNFNPINPNCN